MKNQYEESTILETVWRTTHVFVQMDLFEDYKCSDEVQPAYWNFTLVTIHQTAIYVIDVKQLYHEFCSIIILINDDILVPFVYFTALN